ncbi:unnamed protein product, partial [Amoebophrya sp. A120]
PVVRGTRHHGHNPHEPGSTGSGTQTPASLPFLASGGTAIHNMPAAANGSVASVSVADDHDRDIIQNHLPRIEWTRGVCRPSRLANLPGPLANLCLRVKKPQPPRYCRLKAEFAKYCDADAHFRPGARANQQRTLMFSPTPQAQGEGASDENAAVELQESHRTGTVETEEGRAGIFYRPQRSRIVRRSEPARRTTALPLDRRHAPEMDRLSDSFPVLCYGRLEERQVGVTFAATPNRKTVKNEFPPSTTAATKPIRLFDTPWWPAKYKRLLNDGVSMGTFVLDRLLNGGLPSWLAPVSADVQHVFGHDFEVQEPHSWARDLYLMVDSGSRNEYFAEHADKEIMRGHGASRLHTRFSLSHAQEQQYCVQNEKEQRENDLQMSLSGTRQSSAQQCSTQTHDFSGHPDHPEFELNDLQLEFNTLFFIILDPVKLSYHRILLLGLGLTLLTNVLIVTCLSSILLVLLLTGCFLLVVVYGYVNFGLLYVTGAFFGGPEKTTMTTVTQQNQGGGGAEGPAQHLGVMITQHMCEVVQDITIPNTAPIAAAASGSAASQQQDSLHPRTDLRSRVHDHFCNTFYIPGGPHMRSVQVIVFVLVFLATTALLLRVFRYRKSGVLALRLLEASTFVFYRVPGLLFVAPVTAVCTGVFCLALYGVALFSVWMVPDEYFMLGGDGTAQGQNDVTNSIGRSQVDAATSTPSVLLTVFASVLTGILHALTLPIRAILPSAVWTYYYLESSKIFLLRLLACLLLIGCYEWLRSFLHGVTTTAVADSVIEFFYLEGGGGRDVAEGWEDQNYSPGKGQSEREIKPGVSGRGGATTSTNPFSPAMRKARPVAVAGGGNVKNDVNSGP